MKQKYCGPKTIEFIERAQVPEECQVFQFLFIGYYEHSFFEWRELLRLMPSLTDRENHISSPGNYKRVK
jgi:hypothetical protein